MTRVIIAREKHGERILDASTEDALARSAHKLLKERLEDGHWYYDPDEWDKDHPFVIDSKAKVAHLMALSDDDVKKFPDRVANEMFAERAQARKHEKGDERARSFLRMVRQTVERGDAGDFQIKRYRGYGEVPKAWAILLSRRGAEYESVELREAS